MKKEKLKGLSCDDQPPSNIEEYMYCEGILEEEFNFFKNYYDIYSKIATGHSSINKKIYEELFGSKNYWDKLYNFKDAFDSKYHYFSDELYDMVTDFF
jgi:hypothetical protein